MVTTRGQLFFVDGTIAVLSADGWSCKDKLTKDYMNAFYYLPEDRKGPEFPDPLGDILRRASSELSADIQEDSPPHQVPGRVY